MTIPSCTVLGNINFVGTIKLTPLVGTIGSTFGLASIILDKPK